MMMGILVSFVNYARGTTMAANGPPELGSLHCRDAADRLDRPESDDGER
jgi:hypothetical protein